jgi:hypothetical protein
VLARLLEDGAPVPAAQACFGERRAPLCRFVQEASHRVGRAGAEQDPARHAQALQALPASAQAHVDDFYRQLHTLSH